MRRLYQFLLPIRDTYSHMCYVCVCEVEYIVEAYAPTEIRVLVRISHDLRVSIEASSQNVEQANDLMIELWNSWAVDKLNRHLSMDQYKSGSGEGDTVSCRKK